ncbi:MAG: ABC transporter ATP-binding protein/permease, partial [Oscillospiraceae bacterium]|nr:ABC transporter ATP-binding protein/permease [Oscillospiraceae bacterium]
GDLYAKVQTLSFENIDRLQPASIITRITNDVTQIQNFVNGIMRIMMKVPIMCIGAITLIIVQTPGQLPVIAAILVVAAVFILANMKLGYPRYGRLQGALDGLNNVSREFLSSIRVVKAFNAEAEESAKFHDTAANLADAGTSAMRVPAVFSPLINLTVNFGIILLLWLSGRENAGGIGRLMASVNYMTQILFSLAMVSNILNAAVRAATSSERVKEIFDEMPSQKLPAQPLSPDISGEISFSGVYFSYAGAARYALENINFTVACGETLGIIGPTGSGKSTLINLVPRFYDASAGTVEIDGNDVTAIASEALHTAISVASQKALLFTGTIADNLRWGNENASDADIAVAAALACAGEFIESFSEGYNTVLGQGGVNLSGGQKQRLSIARALLRNPRILILDDCTSALDAFTEAEVLKSISSLDMTILIISQRIATVMKADRILCLVEGRVAGLGTHEQLMRDCADYRAIYFSQIGGDGNG